MDKILSDRSQVKTRTSGRTGGEGNVCKIRWPSRERVVVGFGTGDKGREHHISHQQSCHCPFYSIEFTQPPNVRLILGLTPFIQGGRHMWMGDKERESLRMSDARSPIGQSVAGSVGRSDCQVSRILFAFFRNVAAI